MDGIVPRMDVVTRNNITIRGLESGQPLLFAHGFGCDQNLWRLVAPAFEDTYRVILFDHVGSGGSDLASYSREKYSTLHGYAADVLEICSELDASDAIFVGHSVAAMIGVLAAAAQPDLFAKLVLVGPSPRYIDDADYVGGFSDEDITGLLDAMDSNYLGWSSSMAPVIMGNPSAPELGEELTNSFCRTDPEIARQFAEVTFRSDNRADLARVNVPTLVLQCAEDVIAPEPVGAFVHNAIAGSELVHLSATGHCPNLSAPEETVAAIRGYLSS